MLAAIDGIEAIVLGRVTDCPDVYSFFRALESLGSSRDQIMVIALEAMNKLNEQAVTFKQRDLIWRQCTQPLIILKICCWAGSVMVA